MHRTIVASFGGRCGSSVPCSGYATEGQWAGRSSGVILHSRADDVIPFTDSEELVRISGLPASALIEVGTDHRLADPEPLAAMLQACEGAE